MRIGITGAMGSGKSTVAAVFGALGAPVYNSDGRAKMLMAGELRERVENMVGCSIGDKKMFAERIFSNPELLKKLEAIVHKAVVIDFLEFSNRNDFPYSIIESALIFSSPYMVGVVDKTVGVVCPLEVAIGRAIKRDKITREQVLERMANQISGDEIASRADFVIITDEKELMVPKILSLHNNFINFVSV